MSPSSGNGRAPGCVPSIRPTKRTSWASTTSSTDSRTRLKLVVALTREVSPALGACQLTHLARLPIDLDLARAQHAAYEAALADAGYRVERLSSGPGMPDCVFVEDNGVVLEEMAIVTRPGAESRRGEVEAVAAALSKYRELRPVEPHEYTVSEVDVAGCLHLKSAVTVIDEDVLLVNAEWIDATEFGEFELVAVDPREPGAANALRLRDRVIFPSAFPRTAERLAARGLRVVPVDVSELAKAEGAVTCCTLLVG